MVPLNRLTTCALLMLTTVLALFTTSTRPSRATGMVRRSGLAAFCSGVRSL